MQPRGEAQAQHLLARDGLFLGSSAAMNCVGAVRVARTLGPGHTIVTILCDGGHRCCSAKQPHLLNPKRLRRCDRLRAPPV